MVPAMAERQRVGGSRRRKPAVEGGADHGPDLRPEEAVPSGTGGRRGAAQLLAFCAEHGITADIELLPSSKAEEALTRLDRGDIRYRFVLDLSDLG
jgi:hypothetical protein